MRKIISRKADPGEFDQICMMGFDTWGNAVSEAEYLSGCRASPKYKKGIWYILEDEGELISSLIVYEFGDNKFGIGSLATPKHLRKQGYASKLITWVIENIEKNNGNAILFLYSDIEPEFYGKFEFLKLPTEAQRYKTTTCMIRGKNIEKFFSDKLANPEYF